MGMVVCVIGKVLATVVIAAMTGETLVFGVLGGVLLQTKGLMELVVVTVFRDVGIVSPATYSALVLVALASTALTMPLAKACLALWGPRIDASGPQGQTAQSERPRGGEGE
jgi:Kef-type K+ transport system membrane component KefB